MNICVFGAASDQINEKFKTEIYEMSYRLAKMGHNLVFGAGSTGLMGASARGFYDAGGKIYGFVPKFILDNNIEPVFPNCTELQCVDTMNQRKDSMENLADVFIVVPGGIGTMEEFFEVLVAQSLGRHTKEIILLNIDNYYEEIIKFINKAVSNVPIKDCYKIAATIGDVFKYLEEFKFWMFERNKI